MIKVTPDKARRVLVIEVHGMITEADIDGWAEALERNVPEVGVRVGGDQRGGIAVLFDWEHLQGWERGAKTLGTVTGMAFRDAVRKAAIVADQKWHDEQARIQDVNAHAEVRFFGLGQREKAWAWLTS